MHLHLDAAVAGVQGRLHDLLHRSQRVRAASPVFVWPVYMFAEEYLSNTAEGDDDATVFGLVQDTIDKTNMRVAAVTHGGAGESEAFSGLPACRGRRR